MAIIELSRRSTTRWAACHYTKRGGDQPRWQGFPELDGADLWRLEMVQVPDAVLGTRLEVPTLDGHATVTVPPGTQPHTVLRLPRKGLPVFGSKERGDMYLRVCVHIPERLSVGERALYERLRTHNEEKT